jgi:hypothetical protein
MIAPAAGWPQPNDHGVYLADVCEELVCPRVGTSQVGRDHPLAQVLVVEIGPGQWLEGVSWQFSHGSMGSGGHLPSRTHSALSSSRSAALQVAGLRLIGVAERVLGQRATELERKKTATWWGDPLVSAPQAREARALEAWVAEELMRGAHMGRPGGRRAAEQALGASDTGGGAPGATADAEARHESPPPAPLCQCGCGRPVPVSGRGRPAQYHEPACRAAVYRRRVAGLPDDTPRQPNDHGRRSPWPGRRRRPRRRTT